MYFKKYRITFILLISLLGAASDSAIAQTSIHLMNTRHGNQNIPIDKIKSQIIKKIKTEDYSEIKLQLIYNKDLKPDHLIMYLLHKNHHSISLEKININQDYRIISFEKNYQLTTTDLAQQPGKSLLEAKCPDSSVEFVGFAPNDIPIEQSVTQDVIDAANIQGLKTISLLLKNATRENYFNYLVCPNLKGVFFDGNSHPYFLMVYDGIISTQDIKSILADKFRYQVTNIWVAGEAFEDPMESTLIDTVKAQKFIAGINELTIGPSDRTGACAMKAAIYGKPITYSFEFCYKKYETDLDEWGIGGNGTDFFGE